MKRWVLLAIVMLAGVVAKSQTLTVNMIIQHNKSSLGYPVDLGFPSNASVSLVYKNNLWDLAYFEMRNKNLSSADTFFANYGVLTYNKMIGDGPFFNYFGFGFNVGSRAKLITNNKVDSKLVFGVVLNAGIGLKLGPTFHRVGVMVGADAFGPGIKSRYTMFYFSIGSKIFERKKK